MLAMNIKKISHVNDYFLKRMMIVNRMTQSKAKQKKKN